MIEPSVQYTTTVEGARLACRALGRGAPLVVVPTGPWDQIQLAWQIPP